MKLKVSESYMCRLLGISQNIHKVFRKKKNVFFDGIQLFDTLKVAPRKDLMILKDKMADEVQRQKM